MVKITGSSSGVSLPLVGNGQTVTISTPLINLSQTWNSGAVVFTGIDANFTDNASAATSLLINLQLGGTSRFSVDKNGKVEATRFKANIAQIGFINDALDNRTFFSFNNTAASAVYLTGEVNPIFQFGASTNLAPALRRSGTTLQVKLADNSGDAPLSALQLTISSANFLGRSSIAMTNGAGAALGTLTNAPVAGDPTKWIAYDDNGTTRQIPTW